MTIIFIILLITLNVSVLILMFFNPESKKNQITKNQQNPPELQDTKNYVKRESNLNKVFRDEMVRKLKEK
jgi:hypothetical protein